MLASLVCVGPRPTFGPNGAWRRPFLAVESEIQGKVALGSVGGLQTRRPCVRPPPTRDVGGGSSFVRKGQLVVTPRASRTDAAILWRPRPQRGNRGLARVRRGPCTGPSGRRPCTGHRPRRADRCQHVVDALQTLDSRPTAPGARWCPLLSSVTEACSWSTLSRGAPPSPTGEEAKTAQGTACPARGSTMCRSNPENSVVSVGGAQSRTLTPAGDCNASTTGCRGARPLTSHSGLRRTEAQYRVDAVLRQRVVWRLGGCHDEIDGQRRFDE